jgi:hypothetical protein
MAIANGVCAGGFAAFAMILYFAYFHWYLPASIERDFKQILADVKSGKTPSSKPPDDNIVFDPSGFQVIPNKPSSEPSATMPWGEVDSVMAFKRDLFAYDCICLFAAKSAGTGVELDEEMGGVAGIC